MGIVLMLSLFILIGDVSGTEIGAAQFMSLMEGDSVTLPTNLTEILNDDTIVWLFGYPTETIICQIKRANYFTSQFVTDNVEFSSRVQVDQKTGSITIRNTRVRHSGQYKLRVSTTENTMIKIFNVTVLVVAGEMDGVKSVSRFVTEGESVTLHADGEIPKDALMLWRFGDNAVLLAKVDVEANQTSINDDERFRGRLKVDQMGSLTIPNTKATDSGLYELQIRGIERLQRFVVSVSAHPDQGLSSGAIVGIVIGLLLLIVALALIYYLRRIFILKKQQDEVQMSVMEGDSVTLQTVHTEIQIEMIEWYYEVKENVIADIKEGTRKAHDGADGRFRSKLSLKANGDLTISNTRTIHSGLYILKIMTKTTPKPEYKRFIVTITVNSTSAQEQGTVTLLTKARILEDDLILWTFGAENRLVVRAASENTSFGERFRNRVQMDRQTGALTITNITNEDSGHFKLQITNNEKTTFRRFNVMVTAATGVESVTIVTPLMGGDVPDGENEQQTSSL